MKEYFNLPMIVSYFQFFMGLVFLFNMENDIQFGFGLVLLLDSIYKMAMFHRKN